MGFDSILILDDEMIVRKHLEEILRKRRYRVQSACNLAEAEERMEKGQYDLVFCDLRLPDGEGTDFLRRFVNEKDAPIIVMMTGHGSVENAVECMRIGAFDYVTKPLSINQVEVILNKAERYEQLVEVNQYYASSEDSASQLLGESSAMKRLSELIGRVAKTDATVLIQGETGTGKELISHEIYRLSQRGSQPYIKVNCAAVSETLIESEFFGHEKGAFTGAVQRRKGRFELAHGGTLLLDEISEISLPLQAKLLRVLQEKEFERVGGSTTIQTDVRVIATTNRNLLGAVEKGEFRRDLYYRLNVFPLQSPPLRERREDIPLLAQKFLKDFSRKHGIPIKGCSPEAMNALIQHNWPGNVRELQNLIEHAVIMTPSNGWIEPIALGTLAHIVGPMPTESAVLAGESQSNGGVPLQTPPELAAPASDQAESLADIERKHIHHVLIQTAGNRSQAAEILGVNVRTLRNKLNTYRDEGHVEFKAFD